jgi:hypothetical protein
MIEEEIGVVRDHFFYNGGGKKFLYFWHIIYKKYTICASKGRGWDAKIISDVHVPVESGLSKVKWLEVRDLKLIWVSEKSCFIVGP